MYKWSFFFFFFKEDDESTVLCIFPCPRRAALMPSVMLYEIDILKTEKAVILLYKQDPDENIIHRNIICDFVFYVKFK